MAWFFFSYSFFSLQNEMLGYSMEEVTMKRKGNHYLSLMVPGLAEKRPSLVSGDFIFVKHSDKIVQANYYPYQVNNFFIRLLLICNCKRR